MKNLIFVLLLIITNTCLYSNDSLNIIQLKKEIALKDSTINVLKSQNAANNTINSRIEHSGNITIDSNKGDIFQYIFPSIIALVVGLIAYFATIQTAKKQRQQSKAQFETQITNSIEIIEKQIQVSRENAKLQFKQNVTYAAQMKWINDFREAISDLIGNLEAASLTVDFSDYDKLVILKSKFTNALLLLNPTDDKVLTDLLIELEAKWAKIVTNDLVYKDIVKDIAALKGMALSLIEKELNKIEMV